MVLITDDRTRGGSSSPVRLKHLRHGPAQVYPARLPLLKEREEEEGEDDKADGGEEEEEGPGGWYEDEEEYDEFSELPDTRSIASDDSFYPPDDDLGSEDEEEADSPTELSLFAACRSNNAVALRSIIRQGVTEEEVGETDRNSRTGLIVACYQGYVDVVIALSLCPYVDVNWQDKEGNTALMTACQAGHITITNYLLNYYPGLDVERRNCHGFTALMKAAVQGRSDCVRALMLAGADLEARDSGRSLTPREWALFTGRYETAQLILRLLNRPRPEQFGDAYRPEWPLLPALVTSAKQPKGFLQKVSESLRDALSGTQGFDPQPEGVLDHMVRMTTGLRSPLVAPICHTVCPESPPCVGKRRYAVPEILRHQRAQELKGLGPEHLSSAEKLFHNSQVTQLPKKKERRASLQPPGNGQPSAALVVRRSSLSPLHMLRRRSIRPGVQLPKVRISKAPAPTYVPDKTHRGSGSGDSHFLQIPKWRYKEVKEERKKAEEAEKKRQEEATRKSQSPSKKK